MTWPFPPAAGRRRRDDPFRNLLRPGTAVVTDKGLSGEDTEEFFADLDLTLIRPARKDEKTAFPNWLRQRIESIIWTLKHQLGLEDHGGRVPGRGPASCNAARHAAC